MPNLADSLQCKTFVKKLEHCEKHKDSYNSWERSFITDMRMNFESREDAMDLGVTPWNPSSNQSNTLQELYEKVD